MGPAPATNLWSCDEVISLSHDSRTCVMTMSAPDTHCTRARCRSISTPVPGCAECDHNDGFTNTGYLPYTSELQRKEIEQLHDVTLLE